MLISCCNFPHFQVGHLPHISTDPGHGRWRAPARWRWWCRPRPRRWSWRPPVWSRPRPGCPASVGCRDVPNSLGILGGFVEWWTSIVWEIWGWMILNITWKSIQLEIQKKTWRLDKQFTTISVGDYVPNTWVMLNFDIHQPLAKRI